MQEYSVKLSIIIPCYNEEAGIPHLARRLLPAVENLKKNNEIELLFVDDGSTDNTYKLLLQHFSAAVNVNVKVLKHPQNKNLGAALKTGFAAATGDIVAALDSDCTYDPLILESMISLMDAETDIVTVSPYHPLGKVSNVPPYRLLLSKGISKIYNLLLSSHLYTYTAMVRVYKKKVPEEVHFTSDTFLGVTELMIKSLLQGYRVKEFPAELRVRQFGVSKMKMYRIIKDHVSFIGKIVLYKIAKKEF